MLSTILLHIHSWLFIQSMKANEKPSFWTALRGSLNWDNSLTEIVPLFLTRLSVYFLHLFSGSLKSMFAEFSSNSRKEIFWTGFKRKRVVFLLLSSCTLVSAKIRMSNGRVWNWNRFLFHKNLRNFWSFWFTEIVRYASFRYILQR